MLVAAGTGAVLPLSLAVDALRSMGQQLGTVEARNLLVRFGALAARSRPGRMDERCGLAHSLIESLLDPARPARPIDGLAVGDAHGALAGAVDSAIGPPNDTGAVDHGLARSYASSAGPRHHVSLGDGAGALRVLSSLETHRAAENRDRWMAWLGPIVAALGPDHPDTLTTRGALAYWRGAAGDPAAAVTAFTELLPDRVRVLGPDHPDTLTTRGTLASWRGAAGDPAGAVTAFTELLPDRVRVLGPDHPDTLTTRGNLASWRGAAGDPAAAVTALNELLPDRVRVLGPDHPDTLTTRHNLAYWRGEAGDPAGAVTAFTELLPDRVRVLGPDHPDTLASRNNLASWRGEAGDPAAAVTALNELLPDRVRVLGPDHPDTLTTRHNLASWRGAAGDPAAAAAAFTELLPDRVRVLGPDHPDTLTTRNNLAYWRGEAGDPAAAVTAFTELLPDLVRVLGPDHPDTLGSRGNLACLAGRGRGPRRRRHRADRAAPRPGAGPGPRPPRHPGLPRQPRLAGGGAAGDLAGAVTAFTSCSPDRVRVLGPDHPDTLASRNNLAYWRGRGRGPRRRRPPLTELLRRPGAGPGPRPPRHPDHPQQPRLLAGRGRATPPPPSTAFTELLPDLERVLGPDHPDTLSSRDNLASWRGEAGRPRRRGSRVHRAAPRPGAGPRPRPPRHPELPRQPRLLAGRGRRPGRRRSRVHELLPDRVRVLGPDHPDTLTTRHNLASWRGAAGDPAGAAAAFDRAAPRPGAGPRPRPPRHPGLPPQPRLLAGRGRRPRRRGSRVRPSCSPTGCGSWAPTTPTP